MSFFKSIGHALGKVTHPLTNIAAKSVSFTGGLVGHIPVIGKPFHSAIDATISGPLLTANAITNGSRIDKAALSGFKQTLKGVQGVAPYAKAIIGQVPGLGPLADAGIAAGLAIANGQRVDKALVDGVKSNLPAGVQGIYTQAVQATSTAVSDNRAALQAQLDNLSGDALKAFQAGSAIGNGIRLQTALQKAASTPAALLAMSTAGNAKAASNPVLDAALQVISDPDVKHGFQVAIGTFDHDTPPAAITSLRASLNTKEQQGFDLGLATHIGMTKKTAPAGMPARDQFGYFTIHGISGATPDQRVSTLSNVAHDNSVRNGGDVAAKELNGNWFHHLMLKLHVVKAA